jgi:hypothetical protein
MLKKLTRWAEAYILLKKTQKIYLMLFNEIVPEANGDKTMYVVMSRDQNTG